MKNLSTIILGSALLLATAAGAQDPIQWSFTAKKINSTQYQVQLTASIKDGWHLYSQKQPPKQEFTLPATVVQFQKHPFVNLKGAVKEKGNLHKKKDEILNIESWQFNDKVSFVQVVELKQKIKTSINGSIEFQVCDDEKCLPPKTVTFSIALE